MHEINTALATGNVKMGCATMEEQLLTIKLSEAAANLNSTAVDNVQHVWLEIQV